MGQIQLNQVSKSFGSVEVIPPLDLTIEDGEFVVFVLMMMNLTIIIWMLYTYYKEIPGEILEESRKYGASLREEII